MSSVVQGHQTYNVVDIYPLLRQYTSLSSYLMTTERKDKKKKSGGGDVPMDSFSSSQRIKAART